MRGVAGISITDLGVLVARNSGCVRHIPSAAGGGLGGPVRAARSISVIICPLRHTRTVPVDSDSVDWVISNCVINLSPEKSKVFAEIARVLKPGGRAAFIASGFTAPASPRSPHTRFGYEPGVR